MTNHRTIFIVLPTLLVLILAGCTPPFQGELGRYVTAASASSSRPNHRPEAAFDGKDNTTWISAGHETPWLEAQFAHPVVIKGLRLTWIGQRPESYTILIKRHDGDWGRLKTVTKLSGQDDSLRLRSPLTTRALRIRCETSAPAAGFSISEIHVMGQAKTPATGENLRHWVAAYEEELEEEPEVVKAEPSEPETPAEEKPEFREPEPPPPEWKPPRIPKVITDDSITPYLMKLAAHDPRSSKELSDEEFLELVAKRTFGYFWWETNPTNGLTRDRGRNFTSSAEVKHSSIAAVGFGLAAYAVGAERGWVSRRAAIDRVRRTLRTFEEGPVRHVEGFYPHFVNMYTGEDSPGTEISTIDTALLLCGAIVAMEYFNDPEITRRTAVLFERANWQWAKGGHNDYVSMGQNADGSMINVHWGSYTEGLLVYFLALGSTAHPLPAKSWHAIDRHKGNYDGYEFPIEHGFQSIFRYQYPALFYDFRNRRDKSGVDYFETVTLATLAMRQYCIDQGQHFPLSYDADSWGLGAADGPGNRYYIYGFPPGNPYSPTDGSIIPYAIAGSMPFLPQHSIRALRQMYDRHRDAWGKYGFADCVNPTQDFIAQDALGLDCGAILLGIENHRSGMIWKLFMRNRWIRKMSRQVKWKTRPTPKQLLGPIDLARTCQWKIHPGGDGLADPEVDTSDWYDVLVPDRWENSVLEMEEYDGKAWYRTEFTLSAKRQQRWMTAGKSVVLTMGGVDDADQAFVNGIPVGNTPAGPDVFRKTRYYKVPHKALKVGRNVVAIEVFDNGEAGGIWMPPVEIGPLRIPPKRTKR